uniref:SSRP1 dimerization domain-containing protein n=1 Tax=Hucho hucho TaxID=62062 RepID=A0A4W5M0A9_9TELE
ICDFENISEYFKAHYKVELSEKELCVKGWNWGTAKFSGPLLSFEVSDSPAFEIPLASVSQCATGKNEVTLEFHQNDEAEVSLMEVRFDVPPRDTATTEEGPEPVELGGCVRWGAVCERVSGIDLKKGKTHTH